MSIGIHEIRLQAANFVEAMESRQGLKIACLEEIAWRVGLIDAERFYCLAQQLQNGDYGEYLFI
ncbi:MAG: hypothetical protein ACYS19_18630 [Planctomycetota bacterium]